MTAFSKFDKTAYFLAQAQEAKRLARTAAGQPYETTWLELAESWELLARLQGNPCFCGHASIGYKYFADGSKRAVCGKHMTELVVESILRQAGGRKLQ